MDIVFGNIGTGLQLKPDGVDQVVTLQAGQWVEVAGQRFTGGDVASSIAGANTPDVKPLYRSEVEVFFQDTNHKVNANGELMAPDGVTVYTKPDLHAPLEIHYKDVAALINDALAKNYAHEVRCDGTVVQQGNQPPAYFGSNGDGSVGIIVGSVLPAPVPQVTLPPAPVGSMRRVAVDGSVGQVKIGSNGVTTEATEYTITPAHLANSQYDGFVRVVEAPGSERSAKTLIVSLDGREVFNSSGQGDPAPQCNLTLSQVTGVATITATVQNAAYVSGPADHHIDIALAGR